MTRDTSESVFVAVCSIAAATGMSAGFIVGGYLDRTATLSANEEFGWAILSALVAGLLVVSVYPVVRWMRGCA